MKEERADYRNWVKNGHERWKNLTGGNRENREEKERDAVA
jgi:hypothetical protein